MMVADELCNACDRGVTFIAKDMHKMFLTVVTKNLTPMALKLYNRGNCFVFFLKHIQANGNTDTVYVKGIGTKYCPFTPDTQSQIKYYNPDIYALLFNSDQQPQ